MEAYRQPKNWEKTLAYVRPSVRTLFGGRGEKKKNFSRVGKGVQDIDVAFRFGAKLTTYGQICFEVACVRLATKFSEINF